MTSTLLYSRTSTIPRECGSCDGIIQAGEAHYITQLNGQDIKECPICIKCYKLHQSQPHNIPHTLVYDNYLSKCANCRLAIGQTRWCFSFQDTKICGKCLHLWSMAGKREVHECNWEPTFDAVFCRNCYQVTKAGATMYNCKSHSRSVCRPCWQSAGGYKNDVELRNAGNTKEQWFDASRNQTQKYKFVMFAATEGHPKAMLEIIALAAEQPSTSHRSRQGFKGFAEVLTHANIHSGNALVAKIFNNAGDFGQSLLYYQSAANHNDPASLLAVAKDYLHKFDYENAYIHFHKAKCEEEIKKFPFYLFLRQLGLQHHIHSFYLSGIFDPMKVKRIPLDPALSGRLSFLNEQEKSMIFKQFTPTPCGACSQQGYFPCSCTNGYVPCPVYGCTKGNYYNSVCFTCVGAGQLYCYSCAGSSRIACQYCAGLGKILPA